LDGRANLRASLVEIAANDRSTAQFPTNSAAGQTGGLFEDAASAAARPLISGKQHFPQALPNGASSPGPTSLT
jgi:hypothetical protein